MNLARIRELGEFDIDVLHISQMVRRIKNNPSNVYLLITAYGGLADTVTREAIFSYIATKYHNGNYDLVYNAWLNGGKK